MVKVMPKDEVKGRRDRHPPTEVGAFVRHIRSRLKRLLTGRLTLQRKRFDWQVVIVPPDCDGSKGDTPGSLSRVNEMGRQLGRLLDEQASSRAVLRHLDLLERLLNRRHAPDFDQLPASVLGGAHRQLSLLTGGSPRKAIAGLHSELLLALVRRGLAEPPAVERSGGVQVQEASLSQFMEADAQWAHWSARVAALAGLSELPAA